MGDQRQGSGPLRILREVNGNCRECCELCVRACVRACVRMPRCRLKYCGADAASFSLLCDVLPTLSNLNKLVYAGKLRTTAPLPISTILALPLPPLATHWVAQQCAHRTPPISSVHQPVVIAHATCCGLCVPFLPVEQRRVGWGRRLPVRRAIGGYAAPAVQSFTPKVCWEEEEEGGGLGQGWG
jgi:hypothetical protein